MLRLRNAVQHFSRKMFAFTLLHVLYTCMCFTFLKWVINILIFWDFFFTNVPKNFIRNKTGYVLIQSKHSLVFNWSRQRFHCEYTLINFEVWMFNSTIYIFKSTLYVYLYVRHIFAEGHKVVTYARGVCMCVCAYGFVHACVCMRLCAWVCDVICIYV